MRFAIYARKSVYSDKSSSVDNQIQMCKDYIQAKFPDTESITVYQDEDFSGANANRPDLKRMFSDIKKKLIDGVAVYQLDRLSRSVRDFSQMMADFEELRIAFVSIKESIDTHTPLGKAMTYVSVVFAQLERETIAQRVTDNLRGMAKKGLWSGGKPPVGYLPNRTELFGKSHIMLVRNDVEAPYVETIFKTFTEGNYSLSGLETYFKHIGFKSIRGAFLSSTQLYKILTTPIYAPCTKEIYDYYTEKGCQVIGERGEWDGSVGVMLYGRTTERNGKHTNEPPSMWIVSKGLHEPIISAEMFLKAQSRFGINRIDRGSKYPPPLLKGIIRCAECGRLLGVARKKSPYTTTVSYYCTRAERNRDHKVKRIRAKIADAEVIKVIKNYEMDEDYIREYLAENRKADTTKNDKQIKRKIDELLKKRDGLVNLITENPSSSAAKTLLKQVESLEATISDLQLKLQLHEETTERKKPIEEVLQTAKDLARNFDQLDAYDQNRLAREAITSCTWDGETLRLIL